MFIKVFTKRIAAPNTWCVSVVYLENKLGVTLIYCTGLIFLFFVSTCWVNYDAWIQINQLTRVQNFNSVGFSIIRRIISIYCRRQSHLFFECRSCVNQTAAKRLVLNSSISQLSTFPHYRILYLSVRGC